MRFVLFDRITELKKGERAVLLKNVSQSEDYFIDHFAGFPVVPGSIILGAFEQGAEILLGASCDFSLRPVLRSVSRASFRRFVLPGDQLEISLTISDGSSPTQVDALAELQGKRVANARLEFVMERPEGNLEVGEACARLEALYKIIMARPVPKVWHLWEGQR